MKPAKFDYVRAHSFEEAIEALVQAGSDAKIIAGGQSLMPMINFRLVKPSVLIDINHIPDMETVEDLGERLRLPALVRHRTTASDPVIRCKIPVLHDAMHHVAHMTVRNRGTFCGSVCHADPATEMPMIVQMLDGEVEIASPSGTRVLSARDFLVGSLVNALEEDEVVTGVTIGVQSEDSGWGFQEFSRRHGDFALVAAAVTVRTDGEGNIRDARVGMTGVAETALRLTALEEMMEGRRPDKALFADVTAMLSDTLTPNSDIHASSDYRRNLAGVLAERAIRAAHARAGGKRGDAHGRG